MLVKLTTEEVQSNWEILKVGVGKSLPGAVTNNSETLGKVLDALLIGEMQFWIYQHEGDILVQVVTQVIYEATSAKPNLLIYSLYGISTIPINEWDKAYDTLKRYASEIGVGSIIAYTDDESFLKLAERLGGSHRYFLNLPIGETL